MIIVFNITKVSIDTHPIFYFRVLVNVPVGKNIKYLATDSDGLLYGFVEEPVLAEDAIWVSGDAIWVVGALDDHSYEITHLEFEGDWKDSLYKIDPLDLLALS